MQAGERLTLDLVDICISATQAETLLHQNMKHQVVLHLAAVRHVIYR